MLCNKCGSELPENSDFCNKCGTKLTTDDTSQQTTPPTAEPEQEIQEDVSKKNTKSSTLGCLNAILAPIIVILLVAGIMDVIQSGSIGKTLIIIAIAIILIMAVLDLVGFIKSKVKNTKILIFGIVGVVLVAIIVILIFVFGDDGGSYDSGSVSGNNPASSSTNTISVTFGSAFSYDGFEYIIGDSWSLGGLFSGTGFQIPISVTNISNNSGNERLQTIIWNPAGIQITGYIDSIPTMRSGVSQNTTLEFEYHGDGVYVVELYDMLEYMAYASLGDPVDDYIKVIITLPITQSGGGSGGTGNNYPNEVLYKGSPVTQFLDDTIDNIVNILGTPVTYSTYSCDYKDISFSLSAYSDNPTDISILIPSAFEINKVALNKINRATLVEWFGNPQYEDWTEWDAEMKYYISYNFSNYSIIFYMDSRDGTPFYINIWRPE